MNHLFVFFLIQSMMSQTINSAIYELSFQHYFSKSPDLT